MFEVKVHHMKDFITPFNVLFFMFRMFLYKKKKVTYVLVATINLPWPKIRAGNF